MLKLLNFVKKEINDLLQEKKKKKKKNSLGIASLPSLVLLFMFKKMLRLREEPSPSYQLYALE